ncbi:MAG: HPr family phosphocarrier protein [Chitinivibrionia bacterium]|jgi:phosphocarrier protein|nr:HPr family phosphocarrier protein [Chitinivibrionia bacterium]
MIEAKLLVENLNGIHARPSAEIVKTAGNYPSCNVTFKTKNGEADAKSIMSILMLRILHGMEITVIADGQGEDNVIVDMENLFKNKFGFEE